MEALRMVEQKKNLQWNYDAEVDVLYISIGKLKPAKPEPKKFFLHGFKGFTG